MAEVQTYCQVRGAPSTRGAVVSLVSSHCCMSLKVAKMGQSGERLRKSRSKSNWVGISVIGDLSRGHRLTSIQVPIQLAKSCAARLVYCEWTGPDFPEQRIVLPFELLHARTRPDGKTSLFRVHRVVGAWLQNRVGILGVSRVPIFPVSTWDSRFGVAPCGFGIRVQGFGGSVSFVASCGDPCIPSYACTGGPILAA